MKAEVAEWDGRDVAALLDPSEMAPGRFRSRFAECNEHDRIYGGQLLGQAIAAAARTVAVDRSATYLQFLFAAGGLIGEAIDYDVASLQDGKRFSSRSVRGAQAGGRIVCDASVSFAKTLDAPSHGSLAPADSGFALDPAGLPGLADLDARQVCAALRSSNSRRVGRKSLSLCRPASQRPLFPATRSASNCWTTEASGSALAPSSAT